METEFFQTLTLPVWQQGLHQSHLRLLICKVHTQEMQSEGIPLYLQPAVFSLQMS